MSNCSKFQELISAYADGEVTNEEKALVESHIATCEDCKKKLDFIQKTKEILKDTQPVPVPETLLADFAEFKKKSEEQEKKIVPFYKNYRMYASIAAVFIFAFVLKSGLWQEHKYLPEQADISGTYGQQTLTATEQKSESDAVFGAPGTDSNAKKQETPKPQNKQVKKAAPAMENKAIEPAEESVMPAKALTEDSAPVQDTPAPANEAAMEQSEDLAAFSGEEPVAASGGGGGGSSAYSRAAKVAEEDNLKEEQTSLNAQIYVAEQHLEKARQLLEDKEYFFHQVEQKMSDNLIPFESNFLLLDESVPHRIEVLVKSE